MGWAHTGRTEDVWNKLDIAFPIGDNPCNATGRDCDVMDKTVTLKDIARQARVSPSTVSRVINGSKRVAEDKRALVLAAIEEHRYRPNPVARGLVRGRTMMVGILRRISPARFSP